MTAPAWLTILISALTDFIVVSGTSLMAVMSTSGTGALPSKGVWLVALIGGLVAAGKEVRSALRLPDAAK